MKSVGGPPRRMSRPTRDDSWVFFLRRGGVSGSLLIARRSSFLLHPSSFILPHSPPIRQYR